VFIGITLHSTSLYFATRAVARGAAFISVDLKGGNIDEVDGVDGNDVALPTSFKNFDYLVSILDFAGRLSNPLSS
jgi:hypothetical protein